MPCIDLPLSFHVGHAIAMVDGRRFLVDSGCPISLGTGGPLRLLGETLEINGPEGIRGFNLPAVQRLAGPVDGLLGMDVLGLHRWDFDLAKVCLTVSSDPAQSDENGWPVTLDPLGGRPILDHLWYEGRGCKVLFDTGAVLSYRVGGPPPGLEPVGRQKDWNPLLGEWETDVWEDHIQIPLPGPACIPVRFGQLPPNGEREPSMMGVEWIIGYDLLRNVHLELDIPARKMRALR